MNKIKTLLNKIKIFFNRHKHIIGNVNNTYLLHLEFIILITHI